MQIKVLVVQLTFFLVLFKKYDFYGERKFNFDQPEMLTKNVNITTYEGETIKLPCELSNLGNYHVNWIKIEKYLPIALTVGYQQFSRNMRYRVARVSNHPKNIEEWNFIISRVTQKDSGLYECYVKVSNRLKVKAHINLDVRSRTEFNSKNVPKSEALSHKNIERVNILPNSWIKLRCNTTNVLSNNIDNEFSSQNSELQWFKDGVVIEQDSRRLKKWVASYDNSNYMELDLYALNPKDSGNYQCKRDKTILKNIMLQVNQSSINYQSMNEVILCLISFLVAKLIHY